MQTDTASVQWLKERDRLLALERALREALEQCEQGGAQPTELVLEVSQLRSKVNNLFQDVLREAKAKGAPT